MRLKVNFKTGIKHVYYPANEKMMVVIYSNEKPRDYFPISEEKSNEVRKILDICKYKEKILL